MNEKLIEAVAKAIRDHTLATYGIHKSVPGSIETARAALAAIEEFKETAFDDQIEADIKSGKLDKLGAEVLAHHAAGKTMPLETMIRDVAWDMVVKLVEKSGTHVVVPFAPTDNMLAEADSAIPRFEAPIEGMRMMGTDGAKLCWEAMLAARPKVTDVKP